MKIIHRIIFLLILFHVCSATIIVADDKNACYYLDKKKLQNKLIPVVLVKTGISNDKNSIRLDENGLFKGNERLCKWSLNGGSGIKERFSLDGDFAIPILNTPCEAPFSHKYTGVGFGDWYLILCGVEIGNYLYLESLIQWTRYTQGQFPVKGDSGH
jgi:hypothetical protein